MTYTFSYINPHQHFIDICCEVNNITTAAVLFQLPAWRPGRYELGNFAKNIQRWEAFDEKGNKLKHRKVNKDCWEVETNGSKSVKINYNYYANELNAGSTYLDEKQVYINPVNCCLYIPDRINEKCTVNILVPKNYITAIGLKRTSNNIKPKENLICETYEASDFHELADSPLISSDTIKHSTFTQSDVKFHLWFQGDCEPHWESLHKDFSLFIKEQLACMVTFPTKEYHFLFQILPYKFYHGVEHLNSTVIALGPSYGIMQKGMYNELLGVSSHELFHTWNIKAMRPSQMFPYDYSKENYSQLGFVYEGVTTYYGDYFLLRSGVFSEEEYLKTLEERLNKHFHNPARHIMSVADASFDTWLDGYVNGIPWRKTSIYDEGCITAFMTDVLIRKETHNDFSLDDVMRVLYTEYAQRNKAYSFNDYLSVIKRISGKNFSVFFEKYVFGCEDYEAVLRECLDYIGYDLSFEKSNKIYESEYGFKVAEVNQQLKVISVYPNSPADNATLAQGDEIILINDYPAKSDINEWFKYFQNKKTELTCISNGYRKTIQLKSNEQKFFSACRISKKLNSTSIELNNFNNWAKLTSI